jgi:inosine-uridine nucleoside N-ribohydrolase
MLLGWPRVRLTGITTTVDPVGQRAAYVKHCLDLAGRRDIAVVAGATVSMTKTVRADPIVDDERYWPALDPRPAPPEAALDLLQGSIDAGATVVAIGPYTNLAHLELSRPGSLAQASVVLMGGWLGPPADGLPQWGPDMDFNVQWDTRAAELVVATAGELTLVPLEVTLTAHLREADLPRLRASGRLGALIADQGAAHGFDFDMSTMGRDHTGLPDDLLNFQYDPVACAAALGWTGATSEAVRLRTAYDGELLRFHRDPGGRPVRVVTDLDSDAFTDAWLTAVEAAQR